MLRVEISYKRKSDHPWPISIYKNPFPAVNRNCYNLFYYCMKDILPKDTLLKDILPKDILPNGHFADGRFAVRTFCRTDVLPKEYFAEKIT
jgi:hypothetical protein